MKKLLMLVVAAMLVVASNAYAVSGARVREMAREIQKAIDAGDKEGAQEALDAMIEEGGRAVAGISVGWQKKIDAMEDEEEGDDADAKSAAVDVPAVGTGAAKASDWGSEGRHSKGYAG